MKRYQMQGLVGWKESTKRKPLLLEGARQVGKTTLLKAFGQTHFENTHYINFEKEPDSHVLFEKNLHPAKLIESLEFHFKRKISIKNDLLIFDEVQNCPNALTSLKYFSEDCEQLALAACGSLLGIHLSPVSFPVGKVDRLTLSPMTFYEFLEALGEAQSLEYINKASTLKTLPTIVHNHLWEQFKLYLVVGGLPEIVATFKAEKNNLFSAVNNVRKKQEDLIEGYYADIAKHAGKVNAMHILRIFENVPMQLAKAQEGKTGRFRFTGIVPNINRYSRLANAIDWLIGAGLVIKTPIIRHIEQPLKAYQKDSLFKLFLFDVGLLGAMSNLAPKTILDYTYGCYKGYFAENFVAQALSAHHKKTLYAWQDGQYELEFLLQLKEHIIPAEVKAGKKIRTKSLDVYGEKHNPIRQLIISARNLEKKGNTIFLPIYLAEQLNKLFHQWS